MSRDVEVALTYPWSWKVSFHPLAEKVERSTEDWLRNIGVIRDKPSAERFRKLTVWAYAGWPFPHGDQDRLETIMGFLALWIFYDDIIEEKDDGLLSRVKDAVEGRPDTWPGGSPHYRGWWELGQRYGAVMSERWLRRHAQRFEEWVISVREECHASNRFRDSGTLPKASDHLKRRALNIGMIPNIDFIEYQMGWELPQKILEEPAMKALHWFSSEVVAITNDFFSFKKDQAHRWCNLISCVMEQKNLPLEKAFRLAAAMHDQRVRLIDRLSRWLEAKYPRHRELRIWLERLHHIMYGFARWHAIAPRYDAVHEIDRRKTIRLAVREFNDNAKRRNTYGANSVKMPRATPFQASFPAPLQPK